ncbi:MAG: hypothetical protein ACLSAH_07520 [Bilophila wadsworthia]
MAERKPFSCWQMRLINGSGGALDKLKRPPCCPMRTPPGSGSGRRPRRVCAGASGIEAAFEADAALVIVEGADALAPALKPPTAARWSWSFPLPARPSGLAVNPKAGIVGRAVNAQDIAVTIATIADLPVDEDCTGAIIYQVMKNPNLKLEEIKKLKEALVRMESVIQRDNREPWDKHDCA